MAASKAFAALIVKSEIQNTACTSFWSYLREKIIIVAEQNIQKIWMIQNDSQRSEEINLKDIYAKMDFLKVLIRQNKESNRVKTEERFIWVVNTFITILGEYKFFWEKAD